MKNYVNFIVHAMAFLLLIACKQQYIEPVSAGLQLPSVSIVGIASVPDKGVVVTCRIADPGATALSGYGVCWGTQPNLTLLDNKKTGSAISDDREFEVLLPALRPSTSYYICAYAQNANGTAFSDSHNFQTPVRRIVYLDSSSFDSQAKFDAHWNLYYPWGTDHNGSARMYADKIKLAADGVLELNADVLGWWTEGQSGYDPWLMIRYRSGAVHLKELIKVTDALPQWEISGDFQVPTVVGTWPAFWITGAENWPPESDIMEFKGDNVNWQNTVTGPDWQAVGWQTQKTAVASAGEWHNYKLVIRKVSNTDTELDYYIDNVKTATHTADFVDKPFWLIINLQMEMSWDQLGQGPDYAIMRARNVYVAATPKE